MPKGKGGGGTPASMVDDLIKTVMTEIKAGHLCQRFQPKNKSWVLYGKAKGYEKAAEKAERMRKYSQITKMANQTPDVSADNISQLLLSDSGGIGLKELMTARKQHIRSAYKQKEHLLNMQEQEKALLMKREKEERDAQKWREDEDRRLEELRKHKAEQARKRYEEHLQKRNKEKEIHAKLSEKYAKHVKELQPNVPLHIKNKQEYQAKFVEPEEERKNRILDRLKEIHAPMGSLEDYRPHRPDYGSSSTDSPRGNFKHVRNLEDIPVQSARGRGKKEKRKKDRTPSPEPRKGKGRKAKKDAAPSSAPSKAPKGGKKRRK